MPDELEEHSENKKDKKKNEITTEVVYGYVNETPVAYSSNEPVAHSVPWNGTDATNDFQYEHDFQYMFDIDELRKSNDDSNLCVQGMKDFITENISDSPENVQIALATLMKSSYRYYDEGTNNILHESGFTRKDLGCTSEEIFEKIYNTPEGEMLEGFVCSTISDFCMRLMHECGIEAVMFCGGSSGSDHTALVYKQSDGQYVYVDREHFTQINAPSIKDAAKAAHRAMTSPGDFGYMMFVDENNSYQEYDLADESVYGHELDKRDYNKNIADLPVVSNSNSISAHYNMQGSEYVITGHDVNLTATIVNKKTDNNVIQNAVSVAFKTNESEGPQDYSYSSLGLKYDRAHLKETDNSTYYNNNKLILNTTEIKNKLVNMYKNASENIFRNFMIFNRNELGVQTKINNSLSTTGQVSSTIGLNTRPLDGLVFCGDLRLAAEQSLNYNKSIGQSELNANINAGLITDMSIKTGVLKPNVAFGGKGNADVSIMTHISDNVSVDASSSGYVVATPVSTDYGVAGKLGLKYKSEYGSETIFGNIHAGIDRQNIHIGTLDELTENKINLGGELGLQQKNLSVAIGCNYEKDRINPTKNKLSATMRFALNL